MDDWWNQMYATVISEFSDLPSVADITRITIRLSLAALLGGMLGYEREYKGKAAGLRTHMLVCLGSALFVLLPEQAGVSDTDLTRVIQGVVAGIGFLGAGTILKSDTEGKVTGLTTAAGIWMTAAIGIAAGMGREASAVLSTILALIILYILPLFEKRIVRAHAHRQDSEPPCRQPRAALLCLRRNRLQ